MVDLDKLASEYCSEPYELNAKEVVRLIPDIVAELRASRALVKHLSEYTEGRKILETFEYPIKSENLYGMETI